jgi:HK97 family phage major capsid protein
MSTKVTAQEGSFGNLSNYGTKDVEFIGKVAVESLQKRGIDVKEQIAKKAGVAKEDLDVSASQLYTTAIAGFIERRLRPELVAAGVIKKISNFDTKGQNSIKVPLRSALITAADLPDSGQVSYDSGTFGSTTITLAYSYAAATLTHEIVKFANVDLIAEELGEIGDAIARKQDSDIIAALKAVTVTANGNYVALGATTDVTFSTLVTARKSAIKNYAKPDVMLVSPTTEAVIYNLAEFKGSTAIAVGAMAFPNNTDVFKPVTSILGMKLVVSNQVADADTYLIDTARTGYLVEAGNVEVFDGRRSGYLAYEVIGALNYGVSVVQPKAVYRQANNTA